MVGRSPARDSRPRKPGETPAKDEEAVTLRMNFPAEAFRLADSVGLSY